MPITTPRWTGTFGVEIEVKTTMSMTQVASVLQAAGVQAYNAGYTHRVSAQWKIVSDATVNGGCEVVSPILQGDAGHAAIDTVCAALKNAGCTVDRECGLHVHFGVADLSLKTLKRIAKNFVKWEDSIELLIAESRRGSSNSYSRSAVNHTHSAPVGGRADTVNECFRKIDAATCVRDANSWRTHTSDLFAACGGRGKINFDAFARHGTIEMRAHQGTLNADKINNWVRLMGAVVAKGIEARTIRVRRDINAQDKNFRLFWFLRYHAKGELRTFWSARFRALNPGQNMGTHKRWKNQAQKAREAAATASAAAVDGTLIAAGTTGAALEAEVTSRLAAQASRAQSMDEAAADYTEADAAVGRLAQLIRAGALS